MILINNKILYSFVGATKGLKRGKLERRFCSRFRWGKLSDKARSTPSLTELDHDHDQFSNNGNCISDHCSLYVCVEYCPSVLEQIPTHNKNDLLLFLPCLRLLSWIQYTELIHILMTVSSEHVWRLLLSISRKWWSVLLLFTVFWTKCESKK